MNKITVDELKKLLDEYSGLEYVYILEIGQDTGDLIPLDIEKIKIIQDLDKWGKYK